MKQPVLSAHFVRAKPRNKEAKESQSMMMGFNGVFAFNTLWVFISPFNLWLGGQIKTFIRRKIV
jgi:hypothetical protein